ncbi:hypothetical protein FMM05_19380 [Flavobacterium zepuense]|uniref:Uncharacterized protein n=1 Tax=Flavobacterium zepuense TaxID=2593302 RepID=A0A552UUN0_9FLAO|nr:hypothetical protein [Flavobacterium zepuense]TRW21953.1 hypothetical protein FMM05_19380 [Flavobacterium zepuense]
MFTNISWSEYLGGAAIVSGIYYCFVGIRYYTGDLKNLLSGKVKKQVQPVFPTGHATMMEQERTTTSQSYEKADDDDEFAEVEHLIGRLNTIIADAPKRNADKQEFKKYLHLVLAEYPNVRKSPLRSSVNELIVSECEKYGAVTLTENEVDLLWDAD